MRNNRGGHKEAKHITNNTPTMVVAAVAVTPRHRCRIVLTSSPRVSAPLLVTLGALLLMAAVPAAANPDAKRLYDDLLSHYNRLIRPVSNNSEVVTVRLGLHLSQLIDLVSCPKAIRIKHHTQPPERH